MQNGSLDNSKSVSTLDLGLLWAAFSVCASWRIDALALIGQTAEARDTVEAMLACRNPLELLSKDLAPATGELWGTFPQAYAMVCVVNGAMRLSRPWDDVV